MLRLFTVKAYRNYIIVWAALLVLTFITWRVSFIPLGLLNVTVAMIIASLKASLVALFFMHLRYENKLVWAFALFPLGFLSLIIFGTLVDVFYRG
ncbi:MAG TPA: cytochrome C oxidase subunit IV family protein [Geobacteraceae bacterium]|nr:cytochrome C oxidase subunit IV family protein [Geobacteraceae bacterium]